MKINPLLLIPLMLSHPAPRLFATEQPSSLKKKFEISFSKFLQRDLTMEKLRWRIFPIRFTAENIRLWEAPDMLLAEAPKAVMTLSLKTFFTGRVYVREMKFRNVNAHLRFTHDGKINVARMVAEMAAFARENRKRGQKQKVVYNIFRVEDSRLDVTDADTGIQPFAAAFLINGRGVIDGIGPRTRFPFRLDASLPGSAVRAQANGTISSRPQIHLSAKNVPPSVLASYFPVLKWFTGAADADVDFSKAGAYTFWKTRFSADEIKTSQSLPFPVIKISGFFHALAPSKLDVSLLGKPTQITVSIRVKDLKSKRVVLAVKSERAEIEEIIRWCRTGFLMNEAPASLMELKEQLQYPVIWKATGNAAIQADLSSVLGPDLVKKADGQIELKISDGVLTEMPGFVKTLAKLNLSSLLSKEPGGQEGLKFENAHANIDIRDGVARTRGLVLLESPTLNLGFTGKVNFVKQTIDARMLIGIVSIPEDVIARIPLARRFQEGNKRGVIPFWVAIQGRMDNPNITPLPLNKFDRALWQTLPVSLRLPDKELKKIYR